MLTELLIWSWLGAHDPTRAQRDVRQALPNFLGHKIHIPVRRWLPLDLPVGGRFTCNVRNEGFMGSSGAKLRVGLTVWAMVIALFCVTAPGWAAHSHGSHAVAGHEYGHYTRHDAHVISDEHAVSNRHTAIAAMQHRSAPHVAGLHTHGDCAQSAETGTASADCCGDERVLTAKRFTRSREPDRNGPLTPQTHSFRCQTVSAALQFDMRPTKQSAGCDRHDVFRQNGWRYIVLAISSRLLN
jgi:hypothetical protein